MNITESFPLTSCAIKREYQSKIAPGGRSSGDTQIACPNCGEVHSSRHGWCSSCACGALLKTMGNNLTITIDQSKIIPKKMELTVVKSRTFVQRLQSAWNAFWA